MKKIVLYTFFVLVALPAFSQKKGKGSIEIVADKKVAELVDLHVLFNERIRTIPGYRIMIASLSGNNSKSNAFGIKDNFQKSNTDVTAYLVFEEPNFKVKVGDFKTQLEAFAFLQQIKSTYPNAYIIKDNVYPNKFVSTDQSTDDDLDN